MIHKNMTGMKPLQQVPERALQVNQGSLYTSLLRYVWFRLRALVGVRQMDQDFADEASSHLKMETQENIRNGMDPCEARRRAHIAFESSSTWLSQSTFPPRRTVQGPRFSDRLSLFLATA